MRWMSGLATAAVLMATAGCSESLAESDPNGYEACSLLSESRQAPDTETKVEKGLLAGEAALKASTAAIRESAEPLFDEEAMAALEDTDSAGVNFAVADQDELGAACEDEGFDMPSEK